MRYPLRSDRPDLLGSLLPETVVDLLDHLTDGMFVFDADWHFRYVNEPAAEMLGHTRDELLGAHAWTLFPEAVGGPSYMAYAKARQEQHPIRVTEFYEPLGRRFEIRIFPVEDELVVLFRDITEVQRAHDQLREYADQMTEAERIARFGVWKWDLEAGTVRWSEELHRIYGVEPGDFGGTVDDFVARLHPDDRERVWGNVSTALETLEPFAFEERIVWPDGTERYLMSEGQVVKGPDGTAVALVGVCKDITEGVHANRALGMSERRMRAVVDNTPSFVAVKDLDGHYLMANLEAGRILGIAPDDLIGQECGEVFPDDVAIRQRDNDRRAISGEGPVYDEVVLVTGAEERTFVTVTFALPDDDGRPVETCTIGTDVTERREREGERRERDGWRRRIGSAIEEGRMVLHAQPVIDMATGERTSSELLIRMRPEDGGDLLQPAAFLPAAERHGLIQAIDAWVVEHALGLTADTGLLEVNLSAVTLGDPQARANILALLAASPEAARRIIFEITETAAAEHLDAACAFAADITALGCGLALDDFGTGFGSFTYLRRLPLRYLKIDRTFVSGIARSVDDRRVVQSIIGIAEQFGLRTIAEGVEDAETLAALRVMGADYVQGFHLGRPAPVQ